MSSVLRLTSLLWLMLLLSSVCAMQLEHDLYCLLRNPDHTCKNCKKGLLNINGHCTPRDPNCQTLNRKTWVCTECKTGFTTTGSSNGRCVSVTKNCQTWADDGVKCATCYGGYCNYWGDCRVGDTQCKTYNKACKCASCWYGSPPSNGICTNS